jgi:pSer/pThr/pTyr-binding forkhead associated (FHA) protein
MNHCAMTFAVYRGAAFEQRTTTDQDIVKLGNDPGAHIHLPDGTSRMHAVIEVGSDDQVTLIDLGHAAGTLVNGSNVSKCRLRVGDRIEVGETVVVLESITPLTKTSTAPLPTPSSETANPAVSGNLAPNPAGAINPFAVASDAGSSNAFGTPLGMDLRNPFAAAALRTVDPLAVADDADPSTYTYSLVKTGPDVPSEEVELADVEAIEVMILWGNNVLHVAHLAPARSFYVGEEKRQSLGLDYFIPAEQLGTTRMPVLLADASGARVVLPANARGMLRDGKTSRSLDDVRAGGTACAELAGATELPLPRGASVRFEVGSFAFHVASVRAGKPAKRGLGAGFDSAIATSFGLSFAAGAALIATLAATMPAMGLTDDDGIDKDQIRMMQQYLAASAEREREQVEEPSIQEEIEPGSQGGDGTRAADEEGAMGKLNAPVTNRRWGAKGPSNAVVELARNRARELEEAETFGIISLLSGGDPNAPTVKWGGDRTVGNDEISARGAMWGDSIGESGGMGGLGLSGVGEGAGGRGEGIGLGNIGTYGHGAGCVGSNCIQGFGHGGGKFGSRGHVTKAPQTRTGTPTVSGRIPPEVIQRIVRQNHGRFRMCYEQGLASNPNLQGRVAVRFVIDNNGAVSFAGNGGGDLPSSEVNSCVVRAFYGLSFPAPEGGVVKVTYPIMFSPG